MLKTTALKKAFGVTGSMMSLHMLIGFHLGDSLQKYAQWSRLYTFFLSIVDANTTDSGNDHDGDWEQRCIVFRSRRFSLSYSFSDCD